MGVGGFMKLKKVLLYASGAFVVLLILISIALVFIDFNQFKPKITRMVKDATGKQLTIKGDIYANIFPGIHLSVSDVSFENAKGFKDPYLVQMKKLQIYVSLIDLWNNKISIKKLSLKQPKIYLETQGSRNNWDFLLQKKAKKSITATKKGGAEGGFKFFSINFSLSDAYLSYKKNKESYLLDDLDSSGSFELSDQGKISASGKVYLNLFKYLDAATKKELAKKSSSKKSTFKGWSKKTFEFPSGLEKIDADLKVNIRKIEYNKLRINDSNLKVSLRKGAFNLKGDTKAEGADIHVIASGAKGQTVKTKFTAKMHNANAKEIFDKFGVGDIKTKKTKMSLEGDLDFSVDLSAQGRSMYGLVQSSKGDIDYKLGDGTLRGFDVKAVQNKVKEVDTFFELLGLVTDDFFKGKTDIHKFTGSLKVVNGIVRSQNVDLDAEGVKGVGKVNMNLPAFTGDIKIDLVLQEYKDFPKFNGVLKGKLSDLDFSFNEGDFVSYFTKKSTKIFNNLPKPLKGLEAPGKILEGLFN